MSDVLSKVVADNVYECWECCQGDLHAEWICPACGSENLHVTFGDGWGAKDEGDTCKQCNARFMVVSPEE